MIQFQELPPEILAKVLMYLPLKDILNARQTCTKLKELSFQHHFLKNRCFSIRGQNAREGRRTANYLETFGTYLEHLTLSMETSWVRPQTSKRAQSRRVCNELHDIFDKMTKQLQSFTVIEWFDLKFDEVPFDRAAVRAGMCRMLVEQERLSAVHFIHCLRDEEDGVDVLRALATQTIASKLTSISLHNFFHGGINTDFVPDFLEFMGKLPMLKTLRITYKYLSEDAMAKLISGSPFLKEIHLSVDEYASTRISCPTPDWQEIVKNRPGLRVSVEIKVMKPQYGYQGILLPAMPLTSLSFVITENFECFVRNRSVEKIETEINDVLRYISNYYGLKVFILKVENNRLQRILWDRPNALVNLVKACPSVAHLSLRITVSLEILLEMAAAARPVAREEDGGCAARPPLLIHLKGCNTVLDKGILDRLSAVNAACTVHICDGCETLLNPSTRLPN